jgi:tripartite ATP-independent transporter DctM subunit
MTYGAALLLLLGGATLMLAISAPVGAAFMAINIVGALQFLGGEAGLSQLVRNMVASVANFTLTPIPLFLAMGEILFHTGVAFRAIEAVERVIQRVPGRLSVVAIVAGTVFSAISGSTIATTALLGTLLLPEMLKRGYEPKMAMGPIIAIGGVDMLIPPSALTVLLGSLAGISVSDLLIAGTPPGLVMSLIFVGYILIRAKLNPKLAPMDDFKLVYGWERFRPFFIYVVPLVTIFGVVIGSMAAGWATPTESAALGTAATIIVCLAYRSLTWSQLVKSLRGTVAISGAIFFIIIGATTFAQILTFSGATSGVLQWVSGMNLPPMVLILGMMIILLILGCFIDQVSMMLITLPFFMPMVRNLGINEVWFGVLFLICMQFGLLTPPFGLLLFTMKSVAPPQISFNQIAAAVLPYLGLGILVLILVFLWPPFVTWLPASMSAK